VGILFADKDLKNPYTHQGNVGIEHAFSNNLTFSATYIWSRGVRLYGTRDLNINPAANPITYTILSPAGTVEGTYTTNTYRTRPFAHFHFFKGAICLLFKHMFTTVIGNIDKGRFELHQGIQVLIDRINSLAF